MPISTQWRRAKRGLLILAIFTAGCTMVGPNYVRPKVSISPDWLEAGDPRIRAEAADFRSWWQVFKDPVLDQLIDRAYHDNLTLKIAGVRVLEARAFLGIAGGELYPQAQFVSGSFQNFRESEHAPAAAPGQQFNYLQSQIGLNARWELDFWGKFRRAIESAGASLRATEADYDNALVSLTADVANSYILIRTLERQLFIARENVKTQQESLKIAEVRFKYGTVSQLDVEQARTVLHNTLSSIPAFEAQIQQAKNVLSVLLGMPPSKLTELLKDSSDIPVSPAYIAVGIPADLLRRRPDIRSTELQAEAQSSQIGVAKSDLYPAFSLLGTFGFLSTNVGTSKLSDLFQWRSRTFQAGPSFQWNIFNYGQITNNVRLQDARLQELLIAYQNAVLIAQQEVENGLVGFLKAQERAGLLAESVAAARRSVDLAVLQYREGTKDFTTVLVAQQALLNEQNNLALTLGSISGNLVGVYRALGGGWENREGQEFVPAEIREEMSRRTNWGNLLGPATYHPLLDEKPRSLVRSPDW